MISESSPASTSPKPGNEADDAVETEADARAGDAKGFVEQNLESAAESRRGRSRRRDSSGSGRMTPPSCWSEPGGLKRRDLALTSRHLAAPILARLRQVCFDATIDRVDGGYSSAAERLTVAQDVVGSIPTSRPNL